MDVVEHVPRMLTFEYLHGICRAMATQQILLFAAAVTALAGGGTYAGA